VDVIIAASGLGTPAGKKVALGESIRVPVKICTAVGVPLGVSVGILVKNGVIVGVSLGADGSVGVKEPDANEMLC